MKQIALCALVATTWFGVACGDEESTGPDPVVFDCNALDRGQSLSGMASVSGSDLEVTLMSDNGRFTEAPTISDVSSGTLGTVTVVMGRVVIPITGVGSSASFSLSGRLIGPDGDFCDIARDFSVTVNGGNATVQ